MIEEALLELRSTESGEVLYADYVASHIAYLGFAELGGGDRITAWLADDGLHYEVFFDEVFREASPFARTVALVDVLYVLRPSGNSEIETREQCFEYYVLQSGARAKWWHEKFGAVGKLDPTARERNENENMWLWLTESLGEWVRLSERYQLTCAQYDD